MKKFLIITSVAILAVVVLGAVGVIGYASAQTPTPNANQAPGAGWGPGGMMNGNRMRGFRGESGGSRGGMMGNWGEDGYGPMHTSMVEAVAEALGMTTNELQARLDKGETFYAIAQSQGLTDEQIQTLLDQAHDKALDKAVETGTITQEQADWMKEHHDQMWQNGTRAGQSGCMNGGRRGPGSRQNQQP